MDVINLAGEWEFALDPSDQPEPPALTAQTLGERIQLPGSVAAQGRGYDPSPEAKWTGDILDKTWATDARYEPFRRPGNVKMPFWLTPSKWYVGGAWYRRTIDIPPHWRGRPVTLFLERAHWTTGVWLNGQPLGTHDSLSTPHEYHLGQLSPGRHVLAIRVDNRMHVDVGVNASSVTDHTQTNWNGLIGRLELRAKGLRWIDQVHVLPDAASRSVRVRVTVRNAPGVISLPPPELIVGERRVTTLLVKTPKDAPLTFEETLQLPTDIALWDEFSPSLHRLTVKYADEERSIDFGLRDVRAIGTQFAINGRPVFMRGALDCAIFPLTGYPPTDVESWRRELGMIKLHGLNHVRFHSWCPPEAAFIAADQMGVYLQVEVCAWPNADVIQGPGSSAGLGDGKPLDAWLHAETDRILRAYGHHPSFVMLALGNEPGGPHQKEFLAAWLTKYRAADPGRLYTGAAGWPELPENQYHVVSDPRIQHWGEGLASRINARPPETRTDYRSFIASRDKPVISHEIGQWCAYPNLASIGKYSGLLKAGNFEIFRTSLAEHHMLDQAPDFLMASGKLQALAYKEEIESALRTPGMGGFQLLGLQDFPGQGSALVGVVDPFWHSKGYISAEEYSRFAGPTVPLARMSKRTWTSDERFEADVEIAHFGASPIQNAQPMWSITQADGSLLAQGQWDPRDIPLGNAIPIGKISLPLTRAQAPSKLTLTVQLGYGSIRNSWEIWVYPPTVDTSVPPNVLVTASLDAAAEAALNAGGKVLLMPAAGSVAGDANGPVQIGFSPIFWNTAWTSRQPPHTLGILCKPDHPALSQFPTDPHSNWQWWELIHRSQAMILDGFAPEFRPIVQVIDDWTTNRKLGLLAEARLGNGKLLICSMDLRTDLETRPAARQMLASILAYMSRDAFNPQQQVELRQVQQLLTPPR